MNKIIKKKLITESIRGWCVLDNILFGGKPEKYLNESKLLEYNLLKKKFLKTVFEFYVKMGYKSSFNVLPKTSKEVQKSANVISESLKKEIGKQFTMNEKKYCQMIAEGVNINNDELLRVRTNYLGRALMIENFFIKRPKTSCLGSNLSKPELIIFENCLYECRDAMLNISRKFYKKF
jgi:hypothetical protein